MLNNLMRLQYQLANGYQIDASLQAWLLVGLEDLRTGSAETLDSALGFGGRPGVQKVGTRFRKYHRDIALLNLMAKIRTPDETNWCLANRAGNEILRFKTVVWPRVSEALKPPDRLNEIQGQLWELFRIDPDPPLSATFLFELLRQPPLLTVVEVVNN